MEFVLCYDSCDRQTTKVPGKDEHFTDTDVLLERNTPVPRIELHSKNWSVNM